MKKVFIGLMATIAISFAACTSKTANMSESIDATECVDSVCVDSIEVDSVAVDTLVVDTLAVDSIAE